MVYETLLKLAIAKGEWEELEDDYLGWDETSIEYLKKCEGEVEYNEGSIWLSITGTPKMEEDCIEYQAKVRYKNVPEFTVTYEQEYNEILENGAGDAVDELEFWLSSRIDKYLTSKGVNEESNSLSDFWRENERRIRTDLEYAFDRYADWTNYDDGKILRNSSGKISLGKDLGEIKYTVRFNNFDNEDYLDYDLFLEYPAFDRIKIPFEVPADLRDDLEGQAEEIAMFTLEEIHTYLQDFVFSDEVDGSDELDEVKTEIEGSVDDIIETIYREGIIVDDILDEIEPTHFKINSDDEIIYSLKLVDTLELKGKIKAEYRLTIENNKYPIIYTYDSYTDLDGAIEEIAQSIYESIESYIELDEDCDDLDESDNLRSEIVDCLLEGSFDDDFGFLTSGGGHVGNGEIAFNVSAKFGPEDLPQNDDEESFWINYLLELDLKGEIKKTKFQAEIFVGTDNQEQAEMLAEFIEEEINGNLNEADDFKITKDDLKNAIIDGKYSDEIPEVMTNCFFRKNGDFIEIKLLKDSDHNLVSDIEGLKTGDDVNLSYMFYLKHNDTPKQGSFVVEFDSLSELKDNFAEEVSEYVWKEYDKMIV